MGFQRRVKMMLPFALEAAFTKHTQIMMEEDKFLKAFFSFGSEYFNMTE